MRDSFPLATERACEQPDRWTSPAQYLPRGCRGPGLDLGWGGWYHRSGSHVLMGSTKLIPVALIVAGVLSPASAAQAPELFTYSPEAPLTNEVVTFTAQTSGTITWDLDGDGACDDAAGPTASRSFETAGDYSIRMCVNGDELINKRTLTVQNRVPVASFSYAPAAPMVGEAVTMTSTSTDADGPIVAQSW